MNRWFRRAVAVLVLLIAAIFPSTSTALSGQAALDLLNQQREANGIPAIPTHDPQLASWCPNEQAAAATGANWVNVSTSPEQWSATTSPWETFTQHQASLYDPLWSAAGVGEVEGFACVGLGAPAPQPAAPTIYGFVSPAGSGAVAPAHALAGEEAPFSIQELLFTDQFQETGPPLIFYARGFPGETTYPREGEGVELIAWTLRRSDTGAVISDVRKADQAVAAAAGHPGYLYNTAVLIPAAPLEPSTGYEAEVTFQGPDGTTASRTISLTTTAGAAVTQAPRRPRLRFQLLRVRGHKLRVRVKLEPGDAREGRVVLKLRRGRQQRSLRLARNLEGKARIGSGRWRVEAKFIHGAKREYQSASVARRIHVREVRR